MRLQRIGHRISQITGCLCGCAKGPRPAPATPVCVLLSASIGSLDWTLDSADHTRDTDRKNQKQSKNGPSLNAKTVKVNYPPPPASPPPGHRADAPCLLHYHIVPQASGDTVVTRGVIPLPATLSRSPRNGMESLQCVNVCPAGGSLRHLGRGARASAQICSSSSSTEVSCFSVSELLV